MRRPSISIMSNIAEGTGRRTNKELIRFFEISFSSALELESLLIASNDLGFLPYDAYEEFTQKINEIQRMLIALIQNKTELDS